jgi:hypothetical protein
MMGLAAIKNPCTMTDPRLQVIGLEKRGGGRGIFILNSQPRVLDSDVTFPNEVVIEDLGQQLQESASAGESSGFSSQRFHLEIPPCGVLPLQVMDVQWEDELERRQAARLSDETRAANESAAFGLAGYDPSGEVPWN